MLHLKFAEAPATAGKKPRVWKFVLWGAGPDRVGDRINVDGIDMRAFLKNPIALKQHDHEQPIGSWKNITKAGAGYEGELRAELHLAPAGVAAADETQTLLETGILRAVSVGYRSVESRPNEFGGVDFSRIELLEASIVSVPMHPAALLAARYGAKAPVLRVTPSPAAPRGISPELARGIPRLVAQAVRDVVKAEIRAAAGVLED